MSYGRGRKRGDIVRASEILLSSSLGVANGIATLGSDGKVPAGQLPSLDYIPNSQKGIANGVATLGSDGKVPSGQLPSLNYLPLGGGTMTGKIITVADNYWLGGGMAAMDAKNSDIVGLNCLIFNDPADSNEGLLWPKNGAAVGSTNAADYTILKVDGLGVGYIGSGKIFTSANGGSGSGFDADTVDGVHAVTMRQGRNANYVDFYVDGDLNTYYPVKIDGNATYGFNIYSLTRGYAWPAPATWGQGDGSHKGGLTLTWQWSGDTGWGGNDKAVRVLEFNETYTTMVGGMVLSVSGLIVWLRGGSSQYRLQSEAGTSATVTVYLGNFTAADNAVYAPRTNTANVPGEVYARYPVRANGDIYGNRVVLPVGADLWA